MNKLIKYLVNVFLCSKIYIILTYSVAWLVVVEYLGLGMLVVVENCWQVLGELVVADHQCWVQLQVHFHPSFQAEEPEVAKIKMIIISTYCTISVTLHKNIIFLIISKTFTSFLNTNIVFTFLNIHLFIKKISFSTILQ